MLSQPPSPPVARATASGETKGRLTAPARLAGRLGIAIEGCQLSTGEVRSLVIAYRPRRLRIDGRRRPTEQISTAIRFTPNDSHSLGAALTFSLHAGGRAYSWTSASGTLRWADGLRSGSFDAHLRPDRRRRSRAHAPARQLAPLLHVPGALAGNRRGPSSAKG